MWSTNATQILLDRLNVFLDSGTPPFPWGVGYSGGRDSAVLLWALTQVAAPEKLTALYVDHGWRPEAERAVEAAVVDRWCAALGTGLLRFAAPAAPPASENDARTHRYRCFQEFLSEYPASPVFLAHHADDQAETVLMRLLRGRSWQGLGGMSPRRGAYLRPLLGLRASVLAEVAARENIPFHTDTSNSDVAFSRNFLRHRVFPLVSGRFPRAVEALADFSQVWAQVGLRAALAPEWAAAGGGAAVAGETWDRWSSLNRQAQLLAVASSVDASVRLGRRFLETLSVDGRTASAEGAGWSWSRDQGRVHWKQTAPQTSPEYFVVAEPEREYDLGTYRMQWFPRLPDSNPETSLFVPGPRGDAPLIWRSPVSGMKLASADGSDWTKETRRRRLGSGRPERCALLIQGGLLRAAVDPKGIRVLWSETGGEKLHNLGIFVKLIQRSDYER